MNVWKKSKQAFFVGEKPSNNSSFIFDKTYRTAREKNKCEKNPQFTYFNAIMRMKSKLGVEQHDVYEKVFDPEAREDSSRWRNTFTDGLTATKNKNSQLISISPMPPLLGVQDAHHRSTIKELSFNPTRSQSQRLS